MVAHRQHLKLVRLPFRHPCMQPTTFVRKTRVELAATAYKTAPGDRPDLRASPTRPRLTAFDAEILARAAALGVAARSVVVDERAAALRARLVTSLAALAVVRELAIIFLEVDAHD